MKEHHQGKAGGSLFLLQSAFTAAAGILKKELKLKTIPIKCRDNSDPVISVVLEKFSEASLSSFREPSQAPEVFGLSLASCGKLYTGLGV